MRKRISDAYSMFFPKKNGEEYSGRELLGIMLMWLIALTVLFLTMKFFYDWLHPVKEVSNHVIQ